MSHEFDSTLSAVLRATESAGYVAERRWFPWEPPTRDRSKDETKPTHVEATLVGPPSLNVTVGKEEDPKNEDQPGGVLCSRVSQSNQTENELLMVLLVPETPTWGVDKKRLGQAFEIVHNYRKLHYPETGQLRRASPDRGTELLRLDPVDGHGDEAFSGEIPHLKKTSDIPPSRRFVIYNGGAQNPQLDVLREAFPEGQVTFRSTVHDTVTLVKALLEFTLETSVTSVSDTCPVRRAVLVESNTVFGQDFPEGEGRSAESRFSISGRPLSVPDEHLAAPRGVHRPRILPVERTDPAVGAGVVCRSRR